MSDDNEVQDSEIKSKEWSEIIAEQEVEDQNSGPGLPLKK